MSNRFYSVDDFNVSIDNILKQIGETEFDFVVGIERGGVIPAQRLAYKLNLPCEFFKWQITDNNRDIGAVDFISNRIIDGKRALIVDDISDSGKTLSEIAGRIYHFQAQVSLPAKGYFKTATLILKEGTEFEPNYSGVTIKKDAPWVDFWFEQ